MFGLDAMRSRKASACAPALHGSVIPAHRSSVPEVRRDVRQAAVDPALEAQLRAAILSADARQRLVQDAMTVTKGNRAAAIRKVLSDLHAENNRWS